MVVINDITYTKLTTYTAKVGSDPTARFNAIPTEQYYNKHVKLVPFFTENDAKVIVTEIGKFAFSYCHVIPSIFIPKTIKIIRESAFDGCNWISSIVFEKESSLLTIETLAFAYTSQLLNEIRIPFHVASIGSSAFLSSHITKLTYCGNADISDSSILASTNVATVYTTSLYPTKKFAGVGIIYTNKCNNYFIPYRSCAKKGNMNVLLLFNFIFY